MRFLQLIPSGCFTCCLQICRRLQDRGLQSLLPTELYKRKRTSPSTLLAKLGAVTKTDHCSLAQSHCFYLRHKTLPEVSTKLLHRPSQEYPLRLRLFTHGTKGTVGIFGAQNLAASVMGADQLQNLPLSTWLQTFCDELLVPWQYQEECVACTNVTTKFVGHAPKSLWKAHPPYATRSYTSR